MKSLSCRNSDRRSTTVRPPPLASRQKTGLQVPPRLARTSIAPSSRDADTDDGVDLEERHVDPRQVVRPHERVLVDQEQREDDHAPRNIGPSPAAHHRPERHDRVRTWLRAANRSARATPYRAGMLYSFRSRSNSASCVA